jgi:Tol biopolymer transport system component
MPARRARCLSLLFGLAASSVAFAQGTSGTPPANARSPVVSPDGRRILFTSERVDAAGVYVINPDGTGARRIAPDAAAVGRAVWSADGARLLFGRIARDTIRVLSMLADGSAVSELAALHVPGARAVTVSPDASRIVSGVGPWTAMQLHVASLDGSTTKQLTFDAAMYWCPAISRDGQRVAAGRRDSAGMQIWVMSLDGSSAHQITRFTKEQGSPQCPAWSLDGTMIAVQSAAPARADTSKRAGHVWIVDVATGAATRIAEHPEPYLDELATWFPDGKRIAFQSDRTGRWELWTMNVDGTGARQVTK